MVTQHAGPPLYTLDGDNGTVASAPRGHTPPHLVTRNINHLDMNNTSPVSTPQSLTQYSPFSPPGSTSQHSSIATRSPPRNENPYHHSPTSTSPSHKQMSFARSPPPRASPSPIGPDDGNPGWPLPMADTPQSTHTLPRMRTARPGLQISMSTTSLRSRHRSPHQDHNSAEMSYGNRPLPRFPPRVTPDLQYSDPLRSSQNSGKTSFSSFERMSGTERSSVLTKSSSMTDIFPDNPNGQLDDEDMTVEDAIGMYLDDIIDVPEETSTIQTTMRTSDLGVIVEAVSSPTKQSSVDSISDERENSAGTTSTHIEENNLPQRPSLDKNAIPEVEALQDQKSEGNDKTEPPHSQEISNSDKPASVDPSKTSPKDVHSQKNLSIDTSIAKKSLADTPDQPIPSPRYSTIVRVSGIVPPPFLPGTDGRDRYGFRKASHQISLDQFESWNKLYSGFAEGRRIKWIRLLETSGLPTESPVTFPPKTNVIKRYVRKGIPSEYRGAAWFYYAGGYGHMHPHPGHYNELVRQAMSTPNNGDKEHIERDLYRTFPDNIHFKPDMPSDMTGTNSQYVVVETQMIRSLRRVLYAFALHNPRIGYTQSLNFIAGLLLLFLPEEKTFWMLHVITSELLPATHEVSLEGANVDMWILMVLLREHLPHVYTKIVSTNPTTSKVKAPALTVNTRLPDITLGLTNWLMSVFIGSLPLETTLRVWDCFFYEGSKTFFRVALGIFKAGEREILSVSDPMEVFQIVQTIPKKLLDANALLDESMSRKYRVGQGRIDALRAERREAVRQEKTRLSLMAGKAMGFGRPSTRSGGKSPLPRLDGWRAMKNTFN
ncbi:rab-GTPase-TBC domain-containing protein [Talaromyces proteolyticus]|uniref:Rab-GTPase-TBC domain-containing protein n=1 Tax=Talaromyces proteolyticus TaxID=1131652 RepID=A0AAD4KNA2_9EURO|nr:rab-GTPase-TBC domain-containing protein [Talaromyces proteolyticus]KAH8695476.1 rab-GTPase-TBC domain-containing protein [Talaromyces proteolyticus]